MTERLACETPGCPGSILPDTAARTGGICMRCVNAIAQRERQEFIRLNRRDVNAFDGISDPVEVLKIVHQEREHDPLVNWIPYPVPVHEVYASLALDETARLAMHAESLIGTERQEEAEEICRCLAAFTDANLDVCLRRLVAEGEIPPALAFRRAPADVRDALLARVDSDVQNRNNILIALAWIGDGQVIEQFAAWRREPPPWRDELYIPPEQYAREAGWELTPEGQRRDLYFAQCTQLVAGPSTAPRQFRAIVERADTCTWCSSTLTNLFEVHPGACGIALDGPWHDGVVIATCEICTVYGEIICRLDSAGNAQFVSADPQAKKYFDSTSDAWLKLPIDGLQLAGPRRALAGADQFLPVPFSQLGGHPCWIQDSAYPSCPACSTTMQFLAQIDGNDLGADACEGMYYGFVCSSCRTTATSYQQS